MSFEVHIARGGDPLENIEPVPITLEQWRAAIGTEIGIVELSGDLPGTATWTREEGEPVKFHFRDSHITLLDPDEETLAVAARLAKALDAELQGEDGEQYDTTGHLAFNPDDTDELSELLESRSHYIDELSSAPEPEDLKAIKRPMWKKVLKKMLG
jgi:hypothetical protein